jgi:rRNA maturation RNase YbeY
VADAYISIERVAKNAKLFQNSFTKELCRMFIHAVLHLVGYKDKTPEDRLCMRAKEEFFLQMPIVEKYFDLYKKN